MCHAYPNYFLCFPKYVGWGGSRNLASNKFLSLHMMAVHHHAGKRGLTLNLTCLEHVNWMEANDSLGMNHFIEIWKPGIMSTSSSLFFLLFPRILLLSISVFPLQSFNLSFNTSSQFCHTTDLLVSFFFHFSNISPGLLLILVVIQLVSGPVRQPVELICLFRS